VRPVLLALAPIALVLVASVVEAAAAVPPRPDRYATDRAGVVDAARLSALNERLAQFERETSTQVLVYVDRRLPAGATVETFAAEAFKAWGIGQKDKDNGVAFFVFVDDRKMRIEVGYGLEGALPDIRAASIVEDYAKPLFRTNDYAGGVDAAADQIIRAARGEPYQGSGRTQAESGLLSGGGPPPFWCWIPPLVALVIAVFAARSASGPERWIRGGLVSGLVALPLSMVATVLVQDGRLVAMGIAFLLLSLVPVMWHASQKRAPLDGRREMGRQAAILAGCALMGAVGIAVLAAIWGARVPFIGYVILLSLAALPVAGLVYARDPAEVLTLVVGRLSAVVFIPSVLFSVFFVVLGAAEMLPGLLDWVVPSGLLWLAATVFARARGWVIWPKGSGGGSYSGSGYSSGSSWSSGGSSYSSSSSGSSFSGGGGSSGGGGASGSW
jgi:uncharacterized protein